MATVGDTMMALPAASAPASAYDRAAGYLDQAGDVYGGIATGNPIYESMNAYLNPYYDQVIDDVTGRMIDDRDRSLMRVGDIAEASSAFGGARHGLVESDIYSQSQRNIAEMANNMRRQQFDTAAGLGAQDVGYNLAGAGGLGNLGQGMFNIGRTIDQDRLQQGGMQQQLLQAILSGASGQFDQYMQSPQQALGLLSAILAQDPRRAAATQTTTPGLFDYLGLGAQVAGAWLGGPKSPI